MSSEDSTTLTDSRLFAAGDESQGLFRGDVKTQQFGIHRSIDPAQAGERREDQRGISPVFSAGLLGFGMRWHNCRRKGSVMNHQTETQLQRVYGTDPWTWPAFELERHEVDYLNYRSVSFSMDHVETMEQDYLKSPGESDVAGAWWWLNVNDTDEGISLMVGPGSTKIVMDAAAFHPQKFSLWSVDASDVITFVGYFSRERVMVAAKRVIAAGDCPIIATPYLPNDFDWGWDESRSSHFEPMSYTQAPLPTAV